MQITGNIEQAMPSKSGKTLRVNINNQWYSSKAFELQQMVGQTITGNVSTSILPDGGQMQWLNDYTQGQGQPVPPPPQTADQAFQTAMQQPVSAAQTCAATQGAQPVQYQQPPTAVPQPAPQAPVSAAKDRDASIVAQALTKACTAPGDDLAKVWAIYTRLYCLYGAWDGSPAKWPGTAPAQAPAMPPTGPEAPPVEDYSDEIPF